MFTYRQGLPDHRPPRPMQLLQFAPGEAYAVQCDTRRKNWIQLYLHWDAVAQKRVPCVGPDCLCKGTGKGWAREERCYVPVHACRLNTVGAEFVFPGYYMWMTYLLGFTEGILDVLYEHGGEGTWCIRRARGKKNGRMIASPLDNKENDLPFDAKYPVVETLEKVFGARTDPKG